MQRNMETVETMHKFEQFADGLTKPVIQGKLPGNRAQLGISSIINKKVGDSRESEQCKMKSAFPPRSALMLLTLFSLFGTTAANYIPNQSPPILWRKSTTPITTGHHQVSLEIDLLDPCALAFNATVHHDLRTEAIARCQDAYDSIFMKTLQQMCPKKRWTQTVARNKRFVSIAISLIAILVTASIGIGAYASFVSTSNSGMLLSLEERENEIGRLMNKMEGQIKDNHGAIRNLTDKFNQAMQSLSALENDHVELKGKTIGTSYAIAYITSRFLIGKSVLQDAQRQWKDGRISSALLDYFNLTMPCGDECPINLAKAQRCGVSEDGTKLYLEFAAPAISNDLTLVEADPFNLMLRKGDKTCTIKYTGPQNAILSEKNQCVYAVNVKHPVKYDLILAPSRGCMPRVQKSTEMQHFAVDHCRKSYAMDEHNFIQIKPYDGQYYVYCPESNLTVEGHHEKCPNSIIVFPTRSNFSINELEFSASKISVVHQETLDPVFTLKTNWHLQPLVNWTSLMIDVNGTADFEDIHVPEFHYVRNYSSTIGSFGVIIILCTIVFCLMNRKGQRVKVSVVAKPAVSSV